MITLLITVLSSFLWRVRGGLRFWGHKAPMNKIWYAVAFAVLSCHYFGWDWQIAVMSFLTCYVSYQLYGWGLYCGRLCLGGDINPETDRECELIDDLLFPLHITIKGTKYYLYQFPRLFGFCGMTLTGLIMSFLWSLLYANFWLMLSGLGMGMCYLFAHLFSEYIYSDGKGGWKWGEWLYGAYLGLVLGLLLC